MIVEIGLGMIQLSWRDATMTTENLPLWEGLVDDVLRRWDPIYRPNTLLHCLDSSQTPLPKLHKVLDAHTSVHLDICRWYIMRSLMFP